MLRARANGETFVSATMCPQQCVLVCQGLNAYMCNMEEQLTNQNKMPNLYKRYVDDTLSIIPDVQAASAHLNFLQTGNFFIKNANA